jgi:hypothetical protein
MARTSWSQQVKGEQISPIPVTHGAVAHCGLDRPLKQGIQWSRIGADAILTPMPHLTLPTTSVRASYLQGETDLAVEEGLPTAWIDEAAADFGSFVDRRRVTPQRWAVPTTELWFVGGSDYPAPSSSATTSPQP